MGDLIGLATARELEEQLAWVWILMLLRGNLPVLNSGFLKDGCITRHWYLR